MAKLARFEYTTVIEPSGIHLLRPVISVELSNEDRHITAEALLDSGADANVLPYQLGLDLGLSWDNAHPMSELSGSIGRTPTRAAALSLRVPAFDPLWAVFAWVKTDSALLILGHINFFQEFNVCFFASANYFEVQPKQEV